VKNLPFEPFSDIVEARGGIAAVGASKAARPALRQAYYRAKRRGEVTPAVADELAVELLACHPVQVWGHDWVACVLD
jgi:hypothetical protein